MSAVTREAIVAEAKTWLGTPWRHEACLKGVGVDCAQLLRGVLNNCGATVKPTEHYPPDWHLHRSVERFMDFVLEYCYEVPEIEVLPGDILLWRIGRCYSHGAFFIGAPLGDEVVHAVMADRTVRWGRLSELDLQRYPRRAFRWKGF